MDRRVEGTYLSKDETVSAVERLIIEGYLADEIIIVTDEKNEDELEDLTIVEVDAVDPSEGLSLWEKMKETFSFGRYNSDEPSNPLEEYGVEEDPGHHYAEALESGEIVILVNSAGPTNTQHLSQVNEEVLKATDEVNDEAEAVAIKKTTVFPKKEEIEPTLGEKEQFDPAKAQSAREDSERDAVMASNKQPSSSTTKKESSSIDENKNSVTDEVNPDLTGDEATVVAENQEHVYPDNISNGVVDGGKSATEAAHINGKSVQKDEEENK